MFEYIRRIGTPLALSAALALGACADGEPDADTLLTTDTALANDLTLAGQDTGAAPQLRDVPEAGAAQPSAPRRTDSPARTPARTGTSGNTATRNTPSAGSRTSTGNTVTRNAPGTGAASVGTLPAGTAINLASAERVCTNTKKVGDKFTARVTEAVTANGVTIPAGATAVVTVTEMKASENATDPVRIGLSVSSISYGGRTYPISSRVTTAQVEKVRSTSKSKDVQKVVGGAVIGAIAGQVLGKDTRSTVTGAAAGAAAGTAAAIATADYQGCINEGARIAITLTEAAQVRAE